MPRVSHVHWLITFTPEASSTIVPGISLPLIITVIAKLLVPITTGHFSELEKNVGADAGFCGNNVDFNLFVNLGTSCKSRPNGNII